MQSSHLKKHQKIHTFEKNYFCSICEKAFQRSDTLKKHILNIHEKKGIRKVVKIQNLVDQETAQIIQQDFNESELNPETFTLTYQLSAPILMTSMNESLETLSPSNFR
jgi:phage terminase large subunit-like protein